MDLNLYNKQVLWGKTKITPQGLETKPSKVEIESLEKWALFEHHKQVWRSLGHLIPGSHYVTAQRVWKDKNGIEMYTENADFSKWARVKPYNGPIPLIKGYGFISEYQRNVLNNKII